MEPTAQFLFALVGEFVQGLPEDVHKADVKRRSGVAEMERGAMMIELVHAQQLPFEGLLPFLLKLTGGDVTEPLCAKLLFFGPGAR